MFPSFNLFFSLGKSPIFWKPFLRQLDFLSVKLSPNLSSSNIKAAPLDSPGLSSTVSWNRRASRRLSTELGTRPSGHRGATGVNRLGVVGRISRGRWTTMKVFALQQIQDRCQRGLSWHVLLSRSSRFLMKFTKDQFELVWKLMEVWVQIRNSGSGVRHLRDWSIIRWLDMTGCPHVQRGRYHTRGAKYSSGLKNSGSVRARGRIVTLMEGGYRVIVHLKMMRHIISLNGHIYLYFWVHKGWSRLRFSGDVGMVQFIIFGKKVGNFCFICRKYLSCGGFPSRKLMS